MNDRLAHRGPDDDGIEMMGAVGLGSRRLSIIDPVSGHQPIRNEDGRLCIVFNGEIYNYRELRKELIQKGHRFTTRTDTEVVLHLYEEVGREVTSHLRGMFAFAIWDARNQTLFLARDRYGQKPLFYGWDGPRFTFASELKAILATLSAVPPVNLQALDDYLSVRFIPSPDTMFQGLKKLPAAHSLTLDTRRSFPPDSLRPERYWDLSYLPKLGIGEEAATEEVRRLCRDAVESHLVSDVPVGAFLSGGMDSSLVVAMMAEILGPDIPTFSIGVTEGIFNELGFAAEVAEHCRTRHREEIVWPDLVRLLPEMIYHLEEPSDPVAACMYHAAELASRDLKVVLTGDGGDEVFAGFDRYAGMSWVRFYAALPASVRRFLLGPFFRLLPDRAGYKTFTQKVRWMHNLSFHEGARRYAEATLFFRFGGEGKSGLYSENVGHKLAGRDPTESIVSGFLAAEADADLDGMLHADVVTRLPEHSLMLTDRMTMLHGLEARSPFLDHQLGEFVARLPVDLKVRRGRLKYALRRVATEYLPESIVRRPKQGFMFPLGPWMKGPLVPVLQRFISRSVLVEDGIFRRGAMTQMLEEHLADRVDHHHRLWMLLNVEVWYRMHRSGWSREAASSELEEVLGSAVSTGRTRR
jgi:asparagine synthase (glutamine-hydrolysing)